MTIPISILIIHTVADWYAQTNWQALNKSKRNDALTKHVLVYSLFFIFWGFPFVCLTFVTHWATDYVTSRLGARMWFIELGEPYAPNLFDWAKVDMFKRAVFWKIIGTDQLIHFVTLALTYRLIYG